MATDDSGSTEQPPHDDDHSESDSESGSDSESESDSESQFETTTGYDRDRAAVDRARTVSHLLDDAVRIPVINYRVGLDPILGIMPVYGDAVAAVASLYIVFQGVRVGVPRRTLATMLLLVGAEFAIGSIPVLGTLFDAVVKVNRRNVRTIEAHVDDDAPSDGTTIPVA